MPHIGEEQAKLSSPPAVQVITPGASPYSFLVPDDGTLVVQGGTVSLIEIGRNGTFVTTGLTIAVIPVSRGDQIRITYTVAPTINYFKR
jgi:predicted Rossmann-fold nucleotide-binding protein